jgi:urocanate hydratase
MATATRIIRAPRGTALTCKGWPQEAALRMLMNNLDPDVAERPDDLIVYGGSGKAARNWEAFDAIVRSLTSLEHDETLLVQSGKPVGVFQTHPGAPRVLIVNAMLVPAWATWENFRELEHRGLTMYGQMTAGSWIYIGSQGIVQGTYETLAAIGRRHFGGSLSGKVVVTAGLGGMGGAQPLAAAMAGAAALVVEVDPQRIRPPPGDEVPGRGDRQPGRRARPRDRLGARGHWPLDRLARQCRRRAAGAGRPRRRARCADGPDLRARRAERVRPERHEPRRGRRLRERKPSDYIARSMAAMAAHVRAMLALRSRGAITFDYGNNIRAQARQAGVADAFDIPGFVPEYIRPLFCEGKGPFRWVALSGDPEDIRVTDEAALELFGHDESLARWIGLARTRIAFQGLPARILWLGYGERARFGPPAQRARARGTAQGADRDRPRSPRHGSVASPNRETEGMRDGSDAIADWPILNALLNASSGATWVSVHHGGGVGIGASIHAGMVIVADGSADADEKLERVLSCDPWNRCRASCDAGYPAAISTAEREGIRIPMREADAC